MASGDTLVSWRAIDNEPPADDFALLQVFEVNQVGVNDPRPPMLVYEDAVNRFGYFGAVMPAHYDGGNLNVEIVWMSPATTGNVLWLVSFKRLQDGVTNLFNKVFNTETFAAFTTDAVAQVVTYSTLAVTQGTNTDNIAAGEYFKIEMFRDGDGGLDTLAADAQLLAIIISEQ